MQIKRLRLKQGQRTNLSETKKCTCKCTKKKEIIWKRIKENSKNAESFTKWI